MEASRRSQRPIWLGEDKREWDHFRVHIHAMKQAGMGVYEFAAYCCLIAYAEVATGEARPSAKTLAKHFGAGERRMREAVLWLEEHGWITVDRVNGVASRYFVVPPPTAAPAAGVESGLPRQDMPPTAAPAADPPRHVVPTEQEPENQNQELGVSADGRRHRLPDRFRVSEDMAAWANKMHPTVNLRSTTESFVDYHRARGTVMLNWQMAWRSWVRNEVEFKKRRGASSNGKGVDRIQLLREKDGLA